MTTDEKMYQYNWLGSKYIKLPVNYEQIRSSFESMIVNRPIVLSWCLPNATDWLASAGLEVKCKHKREMASTWYFYQPTISAYAFDLYLFSNILFLNISQSFILE